MSNEDKFLALEREKEAIKYSLGELIPFIEDTSITDIFVNRGFVSVKRFGKPLELTNVKINEQQCINILMQVAKFIKKDIDFNSYPVLEGTIPFYKVRITGILNWTELPFITLRKKSNFIYTLEDYVKNEQCTEEDARRIENFIKFKKNILVAGGTGSGKTTFTNCLISKMVEYNPSDIIYIVEDTPELQCTSLNSILVTLTTTESAFNAVKLSLRCSPNRIIFGEIREGKVLKALLDAWNTGHPGGLATIHSSSAEGTFLRLKDLLSEIHLENMSVTDRIDVIIHLSQIPGKGIQIDEIIETKDYNEDYILEMAQNSIEKGV